MVRCRCQYLIETTKIEQNIVCFLTYGSNESGQESGTKCTKEIWAAAAQV